MCGNVVTIDAGLANERTDILFSLEQITTFSYTASSPIKCYKDNLQSTSWLRGLFRLTIHSLLISAAILFHSQTSNHCAGPYLGHSRPANCRGTWERSNQTSTINRQHANNNVLCECYRFPRLPEQSHHLRTNRLESTEVYLLPRRLDPK